ncbi:MAG: hypothetical protein QM607_02770 [Microbacterium sp.]
MDGFWLAAFWSLLPTVLLGGVFWLVMRAILRIDRNERKTYAAIEAEERAKRASTGPSTD